MSDNAPIAHEDAIYDLDMFTAMHALLEECYGSPMLALRVALSRQRKRDAEHLDWRAGFEAGWRASGEGHNGEYPDEGVPWESSVGREAMLLAEAAS